MKKLISIFSTVLFSSTIIYADVPNTIITENPKREVKTVEAKRNREKAELNLNIKKITSSKTDTYITKSKRFISFVLDNIEAQDKFYLTSNREIFNDKTKALQLKTSEFDLINVDYAKKVVTFKYSVLPENLYLVKYNEQTKQLVKLYRWQNDNETIYMNEIKGRVLYTFTDKYKPFEIVDFSKPNRSLLAKGTVEVRSGENINIDPETTKEIILKTIKGDVLEKIAIINGIGKAKLDDSKQGIILEDGSSLLNFGIGFENGNILMQLKGTTDATKEYQLLVEAVNIDDTVSEYNLEIKPAQYGFKVLNSGLNLDFANSVAALNETGNETNELITKGEIIIDSKGLDIKAEFINNGVVKLKKGEAQVNAKLEGVLVSTNENLKNKTLQVIGKINKDDIKNIPGGEYTGSTELVISIDS